MFGSLGVLRALVVQIPPGPIAAPKVQNNVLTPARTLNLFLTQEKGDPAILPHTTAVADPEFPCAWKQLRKFFAWLWESSPPQRVR
jgi:hypothetical protein